MHPSSRMVRKQLTKITEILSLRTHITWLIILFPVWSGINCTEFKNQIYVCPSVFSYHFMKRETWVAGWLNRVIIVPIRAPSCKLKLARFSAKLRIQDGAECGNIENPILPKTRLSCFNVKTNYFIFFKKIIILVRLKLISSLGLLWLIIR